MTKPRWKMNSNNTGMTDIRVHQGELGNNHIKPKQNTVCAGMRRVPIFHSPDRLVNYDSYSPIENVTPPPPLSLSLSLSLSLTLCLSNYWQSSFWSTEVWSADVMNLIFIFLRPINTERWEHCSCDFVVNETDFFFFFFFFLKSTNRLAFGIYGF